MGCLGCRNLTGISGMGHRYCKAEQRYGPIQDVRNPPVWCPKKQKIDNAKYDKAMSIIKNLIIDMEAWGKEEDGVPEWLVGYKEAKEFLGGEIK